MIDVRLLRTDLEGVRASLARRGDPAVLEQLDEAARLDARLREIAAERDAVRARVNELSKEVGQLRRDGRTAEAEARQAESRELGEAEKVLVDEHDEVAGALRGLLLVIPNLVHPGRPDGASAADNPVVHGPIGLPASFGEHQRVPHWEVGTALGILDVERAVKISGAMFAMTRGLGATLSRALCQFALDRNADAFEEIRPPSLVTTATLTASGQLPKFADDAFAIERDELWCIPTAEVPLTSMFGDEILAEAELPRRLMAYTPCFRREAGAAGRDTRGLLRSHEFDKVEILAIATPEQAPAMHDELLGRVEALIAELGLPYRSGRDLRRRPRAEPPPPVRRRGLRARCRSVARGLVGELVLRLPGAPGQHPLPARRAEGHRDRPHAQRLGARRAPRARRDPRELPPARRLGDDPGGAAAVHPRRRAHRRRLTMAGDDELRSRRVQYETAGLDVDDVDPDPIVQWQRWYDDASTAGVSRAQRDGRGHD